jgi:hypothetical protein
MTATGEKTVGRVSASPALKVQPIAEVVATSVQLQGLRVSSPSDPAEREAESTAQHVMRMSATAASPEPRASGQAALLRRHEPPSLARFSEAAHLLRSSTATPLIQRKGEGERGVAPADATEIANAKAAGAPLPAGVKRFMEPRFGADFGKVRIHTGDRAAALSHRLNAQAFTHGNHIFFGSGKFKPDSREGKTLIAHELTHTIQQGATVQRSAEVTVSERSGGAEVQRFPGMDTALKFIADAANAIPGFRMFTIVIGVNPIDMSAVDRSAANILRAVVEFMPGGILITKALDAYGIFDKVGGWIEAQLRALGLNGATIQQALLGFVKSLGPGDLFNLGGVWNRAKSIFTDVIDKIIALVKSLAATVLKFIKDAILKPIAGLASQVPAWDLLTAVLGRNPITGEAVPRTADTLIGGFMKLIGQDEIWANIKKGNAIARALAWFQGAMSGALGFVQQIPALFMQALQSLVINDLVALPSAFAKVGRVFSDFFGKFFDWAGTTIWNLLEIVFDVVSPGALGYIKKTGAALKSILKNPLPFVGNLVSAAKLGFTNFGGNFVNHLKAGLIEWLTGSLPGVYIPKGFALGEIVKFVLSVLGISWASVRPKLVKATNEKAVALMEAGFKIVTTLVKEGPAAAWEQLKSDLADLRDTVIQGIISFVVDSVVKKAVPKLISMFIPGAGFISAILSIYDTVMVFVQKISKIIQVVTGFIDSIVAIAGGAIGAAANRVEKTLAGLLSLAISFLAGFVGLGKVSDKVMGVITKLRARVDKALDRLIAWIVMMAKKLFSKAFTAAKKAAQWWTLKKQLRSDEGETHTIYFSGERSAAKFMMASSPMAVTAFIDSKRAEAKKDAKKAAAIAAVAALVKKVESCEKYPEDKYEDAQRDISAAMNEMQPHLVALLSDGEWGTAANPLPLEYAKRRAGSYPVLYFGPRSQNSLPQTLLAERAIAKIEKLLAKAERVAWKDRTIKRYAPYGSQALPGGGPIIGLSDEYKIEVGKKLLYKPGSTAGGGLINQALAPYGYRARAEGKDGDHVVEMQIGGPNIIPNLWPLDKGENRSSGATLAARRLKKPDGKEISMSDANAKRKNNLWLIIVKTL